MQYRVRHTTRQRYERPISENVMEVRLRPRTDARQSCRAFTLLTVPRTKPSSFVDYLGNYVHTFDVPGRHQELIFTAESVVDVRASTPPLPGEVLPAWEQVDSLMQMPVFWEMTTPTPRTTATPLLDALARELEAARRTDPLTTVTQINERVHAALTYASGVTNVRSNIDEALITRSGVCQDFTHIMLALLRNYLRLPCRYVSGYLYHREDDISSDDASHAWLEAYIPEEGWIGFDPTNSLVAGERHIRVAYGRDYDDVTPTRGVFQGATASSLTVAVSVQKLHEPAPSIEEELWLTAQQPAPPAPAPDAEPENLLDHLNQQQQQQQ